MARDPDGSLAADREVTVRAADRNFWDRVDTNEDGTFAVEDLAPGSYELHLGLPAAQILETIDEDGEVDWSAAWQARQVATVTVESGEVTRVELGGAAQDASLFGLVTRGGEPVAGVSVSLQGQSGAGGEIETDVEGRYHVDGLDPEVVQVRFRDEGAAMITERVALTPGENVLDVELPVGSIAGTIVDTSGAPIGGVGIVVSGVGDDGRLAQGFANADEQGLWRIEGLPGGTYRASSGAAPGFFVSGAQHAAAIVSGLRLEPGGAVEGVRLVRAPVGGLLGTVLDADGNPASGALVYVWDASGELVNGDVARTDAKGEFTFENLPASEVRVVAVRDLSVSDVSPRQTPRADVPAHVELVLGAGALLELVSGEGRAAMFEVRDGAGRDWSQIRGEQPWALLLGEHLGGAGRRSARSGRAATRSRHASPAAAPRRARSRSGAEPKLVVDFSE